jgi:hypothetical protein
MSAPTKALPTPVQGDFSTDLCDCCAEPLGASGCLYHCCCPGCAVADMAVKMSEGEVDRPTVKIPDCCICCADSNADWNGYPWINIWTQCCGVWCGALCCYGDTCWTMAAFRSVRSTYGLVEVDACGYCLLTHCCCSTLCVELQIHRELIIRTAHRRRAGAAGVVQMTSPSAQTMVSYSSSTGSATTRTEPQFTIISAPENKVYRAWFQIAASSTASAGQLTPQEARDFLQRSGLPAPTLAHVWTTVEARGGLNYHQFVMACRLIAMVQNGTAQSMTQEEGRAAMRSPLQDFPQMQGV